MRQRDLDAATEWSPVERSTYLFGLWAGRTLGFKGQGLQAYVRDVLKADRAIPGPHDVIAKVHTDFAVMGIPSCEQRLLDRYCHWSREARRQMTVTD
ncbi:MAG: ATPase inhibitor subunit zeta [Hyphomicrobiales bacterium]|jgi:hypothetical protein